MENETMANRNNSSSSSRNELLSDNTATFWLVAFVALSLLIVVWNLATVLTFLTNRHICRRSMYCLVNLVVADMLYGLFSTAFSSYYFISHLLHSDRSSKAKFGFMVSTEVMFLASLLSLVAVPVERCYATFFPFRYRSRSLRFYRFFFILIWLLSLTLVLPYSIFTFFVNSSSWFSSYFFFAFDLFLIIIVVLSYTAIFVKVKLQNARHQQSQQQSSIQRTQRRERHMAMTLFCVTIFSLITWLPYIIFEFMRLSYPSRSFGFFDRYLVEWIQLTNSLINPIVCLFRMKDFRRALFKLVFRCSRDQRRVLPTGSQGEQRETEPVEELRV